MIGVDISLAALELRSITVYILGEAYKPGAYTLSALAKEQLIASKHAEKAIKKYKINKEKVFPTKL